MKAGVSVKEFYLDKGAAREQDRIIALLEVDAERQTQYCKPLNAEHCHSCFESVRLIALIKGEK